MQKTIWYIGDNFLCEIDGAFKALNNRRSSDGRPNRTYMNEYYNTQAYWRSPFAGVKSPVRRILNSLIDAINDNTHNITCYLI